ncbi:O-antigen polysaccharide polymerase Wzy [Aggregicoccus sp. 17bor-14]|uniref:O-antigen polysaccharide polymerase Wzy n=1 Tax=Myxococcaceae TaxID=31 RepID=UPI00129D201A|nr:MULTISPECIES: O-antigen polysaccharide polymerase Wzy [Myxococcaceae]MBF5043463.1 O-antigen polysaccharide polymerase Wzy [Simulacricoccus sp. 17bor-14]MRI89221.1 O-antigen polysaccharide polymerase Wzy [Aggregicoccus sp. 17bor-14]
MRLLIPLAALVAGLLLLLAAANPGLVPEGVQVPLVLGVWGLALPVVFWAGGRTLLCAPGGYLVILGLFHLGYVVPVWLGQPPGEFSEWLSSEWLGPALLLCGAAFAFLAAGCAAAALRSPALPGEAPAALEPDGRMFWAGALLAGGGFALALRSFWQLGLATAGYGESYALRAAEDPRGFGVGLMFLLMGTLLGAAGATLRQLKVLSLGFVLGMTPFFVFGFRGPFLVYAFALLCVWRQRSPRAARRIALMGAAVVMVAVPAVRIARTEAKASMGEAAQRARATDFFTEAGGSLQPLVATVEALEADDVPEWKGRSYVMAAALVVPNLSFDWSPKQLELQDQPPAQWISRRENPWLFERGGGIGYSGIAEPYLNFGTAGLAVWFLAAGYALTVLEQKSRQGTFWLARSALVLAPLLWTARNDMTNFVRPAVWACLLVGALAWLRPRPARLAVVPREGPYPEVHREPHPELHR